MLRSLLVAGLMSASLANAAGLAGTYVIDNPQGRIVASIEVRGDRLTGSVDFSGQAKIDLAGTVNGNKAHGSASSKDGSGEFEATVQDDTLDLVISQQDGPGRKAARLPLRMQRSVAAAPAAAGKGGGDPRLVGNWVHQNLIISGNASFASEEHLAFRMDGSFVYAQGAAAGGGSDWSFDGGKGADRQAGLWRARDGILFVLGPDGQWNRVGRYGMTEGGGAMRITYDGGGKKLWTRN